MVFMLASAVAHAQSIASINRADTLSVSVFFRQSRSEIDPSFRDNGRTLAAFTEAVERLNADSTAFISAVRICGSASPEGTVAGNERLGRERAESIRGYLLEHTTLSPAQIRLSSVGADWEGFRRMMEGSGHPYRDGILKIIDDPAPYADVNGVTVDRRLGMLKALDGGRVWDWLLQGPFAELRQAGGGVKCIVTYLDTFGDSRRIEFGPSRTDTLVIVHKDTIYNHTFSIVGLAGDCPSGQDTPRGRAARQPRRFRTDSLFRVPVMAFRTNLLVPGMNLGVELPMGNRWSVEGDYYTPWAMREWVNVSLPPFKYCFEWQSAYIGARLWLGRNHSNRSGDARYRLLGHSLGLYGAWARYDLGYDYHGQQGDAWAAGVDYKYALPVGKKGRVHFEFTVGGGIYYNRCRDYRVPTVISDGEVTLQDSDPDLIGDGPARELLGLSPFKAGVSLVIPVWKKTVKEEDAR